MAMASWYPPSGRRIRIAAVCQNGLGLTGFNLSMSRRTGAALNAFGGKNRCRLRRHVEKIREYPFPVFLDSGMYALARKPGTA